MRFAPEGWPFVVPFVVAGGLLGWLGSPWGLFGALALGGLVLLFFRDPSRHFDGDSAIVLAPADGKIIDVTRVEDPDVAGGELLRIATFLSVFDVHVQRAPTAGVVTRSIGKAGRKLAAFDPRAAAENESHLTVIRNEAGELVGIRQIAGLVARRVVPYLAEGDSIGRGGHLGLIKFGSRVDLMLPLGYRPLVSAGQRVRAGLTPMAEPGRPSDDSASTSTP